MQDATIYRPRIMCLLAVAALSGFSGSARANVSLKPHLERSPSSSVWGKSDNFIVTGEQLSFHCAPASVESFEGNYCDVSAEYHIRADRAETATLMFVLPTDAEIQWSLEGAGGTAEAVFESRATDASSGEGDDGLEDVPTVIGQLMSGKRFDGAEPAQEDVYSLRNRVNIYSAEFQAEFAPGDQVLRIDYRQPVGYSDRGFRIYPIYDSTKYERFFGYEVWPLKTWTLAPDFEMITTLTMPKTYFSGFQRLTGQYGRISCSTAEADDSGVGESEIPMEFRERGGVITGTFVFGEDNLPDRFSCLLQ